MRRLFNFFEFILMGNERLTVDGLRLTAYGLHGGGSGGIRVGVKTF
jgi:hypothetical protein